MVLAGSRHAAPVAPAGHQRPELFGAHALGQTHYNHTAEVEDDVPSAINRSMLAHIYSAHDIHLKRLIRDMRAKIMIYARAGWMGAPLSMNDMTSCCHALRGLAGRRKAGVQVCGADSDNRSNIRRDRRWTPPRTS
jgi:hypothetical protein